MRTAFAQVNFIGPNDGILILQPKYANATKRFLDTWNSQEIRAKLRPAFNAVYGPDIRIQLRRTPASDPNAATTFTGTATQSPSVTTPAPTEPNNQLSDQRQPFNLPNDIDTDPTVQSLRNLGGRVISVDDG